MPFLVDRRGAAAAVYPRMVGNVLVLGLRDDDQGDDGGELERSQGAARGSEGADRGMIRCTKKVCLYTEGVTTRGANVRIPECVERHLFIEAIRDTTPAGVR